MDDYELSPKYEISPRYYGSKSSRKEEKIFRCKVCKRTFNRRHNLTKHERVHSGDKPYSCKECSKRFADSSNLTKHIQRVHQVKNGLYSAGLESKESHQCEVCVRCFPTAHDLFKHEMKYATSKVWTCIVCDKSFHLRNSYARHTDTHNEKRRYHCDMCERTFSQKFLLEKHRQYHATYQHDIGLQLDEEYNEDYNEDEEHDDEDDDNYNINNDNTNKYESDIDGNQRERIGKGITVHECTICDKVFTYRSLWTRHLKSHSQDNSFKCDLCQQVFKRQYYLSKHKRVCKGQGGAFTADSIAEEEPSASSTNNRIDLGVTRDPWERRKVAFEAQEIIR